MPLIRSISGLRGTLGDALTPEVIIRFSAAFAEFIGGGLVVVGRDGRPSGEWIADLVAGTLRACGCDIEIIGTAPTPTVQLATEKSTAGGGISITASHNPSEWNGLKFLNSEGIFLGPEGCERFFALVDKNEPRLAEWNRAGVASEASHWLDDHVTMAVNLPFVRVDTLRERAFRVVVDAVNASGSVIVPRLLTNLGCDVIPLFCDGTGLFPHTPEPLPQNLTQLCEAVVSHRADLGISVDPDADRLVLIDENGRPIGEEYTITLAADYILRWERKQNAAKELSAVVNLSTTRAVEDVAARYNATVGRTPVGEINVALEMKRSGAVIGGEGSGGVILPSLHYGRDSLAGIVIALMHLVESCKPLSALRSEMPSYVITKKKIDLNPHVNSAEILRVIAESQTSDVRVTTSDGVKLDFARSWVHLRASNTEPIIRVIAEAPSAEEADELAGHYVALIEPMVA